MQILLKVLLGIVLTMSTICYAEEAKETKDTAKKNPMILNTNAFLDKSMLPTLYTCDGKDVNPQLDWTGLPANTASLALVMQDPDAPNGDIFHWVVFNIPTSTKEIKQGGKIPTGALIGKNSFNKDTYSGPCPAKGTSHTYLITLYALNSKLNLPAGTEAAKIVTAMKSHIIGKVELSTVYSRWIQ